MKLRHLLALFGVIIFAVFIAAKNNMLINDRVSFIFSDNPVIIDERNERVEKIEDHYIKNLPLSLGLSNGVQVYFPISNKHCVVFHDKDDDFLSVEEINEMQIIQKFCY